MYEQYWFYSKYIIFIYYYWYYIVSFNSFVVKNDYYIIYSNKSNLL